MGHEPRRQPEMEPEYKPDASGSDSEMGQSPMPSAASGGLTGQTLADRYRFDALIGEGSFARVFKVYDLERRVFLAAKVLRSDIAQEPAFMERFRREAAVLARLQHPNIVRYYDIVESGDTVFILTDYIPGRTLQSILRGTGQPLSPFDSLVYLRPLAAALHFAHRQGVVHRDLKPANIVLDDNNNLYVTDFGIARILTESSTLTVDSTVGTPHYMSPEQIMAAEVTEATDIYALGVMLYQMYTGQLPFTGDSQQTSGATTAVRIAYEHLHVAPTPPTQINRRLSVAVEDVVLRCLEKDPAQRYQSISDVYEALTDAIGTPSISLDAALAQMPALTPEPELEPEPDAERVPTGVGGMSSVMPEEDYIPQGKRKRKAKRQAARSEERREKGQEKEGEKQSEKQKEQAEKEREKGPEKADAWGDFWADFGINDRLSQFTLGGMALWAGIVFMLGLSNEWAWIMTGAGALLLAETAARIVSPAVRARPGARMVLGSILLTVGLSNAMAIGTLWPLILIAIGVSLLFNRLAS